MKTKLSQKEICLKMLQAEKTDRFIPAHEFVGEKKIDGEYYFLPYTAPKRLSTIKHQDNIEWTVVTGKTGAKYQAFRLKNKV